MQLYRLSFPNGKKYIGITSKTAKERFKEHCAPSNRINAVQHAIHKYGKESVKLTVLAECDNWELLNLAEIEAVEKFNTFYPNGYNLTLGGDGALGAIRTNEVKLKNSIATSRYFLLNPAAKLHNAQKTKEQFINNPLLRIEASKRQRERHLTNPFLARERGDEIINFYDKNPELKKIMSEKKTQQYIDNPIIKEIIRKKAKDRFLDPLFKLKTSLALRTSLAVKSNLASYLPEYDYLRTHKANRARTYISKQLKKEQCKTLPDTPAT